MKLIDKDALVAEIKLEKLELEIAEKEGFITEFGRGHLECLDSLLSFIDSLQEEPVSKFDAAIQEGDDVRYNKDLGCRVNLSQLKRVAKKDPKYCIYTMSNYTDEDRKILCEGCNEDCEYSKKEEPVSGDLEK